MRNCSFGAISCFAIMFSSAFCCRGALRHLYVKMSCFCPFQSATGIIIDCGVSVARLNGDDDLSGEEEEESPITQQDICTVSCPRHEDETIKFHCPAHSFLGCSTCITLDHRTCKGVQFLPDIAKSIKRSDRYRKFNAKLQDLYSKSDKLQADVKDRIEIVDNSHAETMAVIKEFKQKLLKAIDKLEADLLEKINMYTENEKKKLFSISTLCTEIMAETESLSSMIDDLERTQQNCNLFVEIVMSKSKLQALDSEIKQAMRDSIQIKQFTFKPNATLSSIIKEREAFGHLTNVTRVSTTKAEYIKDIIVRSFSDSENCRITGSTFLSNDNLVLADNHNKKVKVIDTMSHVIKSELRLSSRPWGVAEVYGNGKQVVVSLPNEERVVFVKTEPMLRVDRKIKVDGQARGVGCLEKKLVVSYVSPHKVEVLNMQGVVLKKFENDSKGNLLFNLPLQVGVSRDQRLIYVSNWFNSNVLCMRLDGTVVSKYTDKKLKRPWQIAFDTNGKVYVSGRDSQNIHQITEDGDKVEVLLKCGEGFNGPESLSYSDKDGLLYVGMRNSNTLKLFQLKI